MHNDDDCVKHQLSTHTSNYLITFQQPVPTCYLTTKTDEKNEYQYCGENNASVETLIKR